MCVQVHFGRAHIDVMYVPARLSLEFLLALSAFAEQGLHHALALHATFSIISQSALDFEVRYCISIYAC